MYYHALSEVYYQAERVFAYQVDLSYAENYGYRFSLKLYKNLQQIFELNKTKDNEFFQTIYAKHKEWLR